MGETGECGVAAQAWISTHGPHHGEENPLRGTRGSGTIFFSGCNLNCLYCQNAEISQNLTGREVSARELAGLMLELQAMGCHNINLVSPSHVVPQIVEAVLVAAREGLRLPLVYNTGGYDAFPTLQLLDGIIDIYLPDMKYSDDRTGLEYSGIPNYPAVNQAAVLEMHRQVGDLKLSADGAAERGLLIRHLILPGGAAGSEAILIFIRERISQDTYLNVMDQYRPAYQVFRQEKLNRRISKEEYEVVLDLARRLAFTRLEGLDWQDNNWDG
jgi:putative pyruvate formate lyase activating enzyme